MAVLGENGFRVKLHAFHHQLADGQVDEIMGVRHRELMVEGVQFHPESILTQHGHAMLKNFLEMKAAIRA